MNSILDIAHELQRINAFLQSVDDGDEESRDIRSDLLDWLADTQQREGDKLDSYYNLITLLEAEVAIAKSEAEKYKARADARTRRIKYLKDILTEYFDITGRKKVQTSTGRTITICANGGSLPVVYNVPPDELQLLDSFPEQFVSVIKRFNNIAVRKALEAGEVLEFAHLGERGTHVRIT